jgi:hypothetical protein
VRTNYIINNKKKGKERQVSYQKNEEIPGRKAHTNTWKLN